MVEVNSLSPWVGRILTCNSCNRSYKVEAGDKILATLHYYFFRLPCGCVEYVNPQNADDFPKSK